MKKYPTPNEPRRATLWHDEATVVAGAAWEAPEAPATRYQTRTYQEPPADGDAFTHSFILAAGTYTFSVLGSETATSRGRLDWYIDGVKVVSLQDWYSGSTVSNPPPKTATVTLTTGGRHTLKGVVNGKNASATSYYLMFIKYWFAPAAD